MDNEDKRLTILVESPTAKQLYNLGAVIQRAYNNGFSECACYTNNIGQTEAAILYQQLRALDYSCVVSTPDNKIKLNQADKIDSFSLDEESCYSMIMKQKKSSVGDVNDALILVSSDTTNISNVSKAVIGAYVLDRKNIHMNDSWVLPPSYSKEIIQLAGAVRSQSKLTIAGGNEQSGAYDERPSGVMPKTVAKYGGINET